METQRKMYKESKFVKGSIVIAYEDVSKGTQYKIPSNAKSNGWEHGSKGKVIDVVKNETNKKILYKVENLDKTISNILTCSSSLLISEEEYLNRNGQSIISAEMLRSKIEKINIQLIAFGNQLKFLDDVGMSTLNLKDERLNNLFEKYEEGCKNNDTEMANRYISIAKRQLEIDALLSQIV